MKSIKYLLAATLIPVSLWAGTLTGSVSNTTNTVVIENALVVIRQGSSSAAVCDSVRTNASGVYSFTALPAATYYVTTSATGYVTISSRSVSVPTSGTSTSNFTLTPAGGVISGTARSGGSPIFGLGVTLRRGSATSAPIGTAVTDSTGTYIFSNLPSGTPNYYVTIFNSATNQTLTNSNIAVTTGNTTTSNFLPSTTALRPVFATAQSVRWVRAGDRLTLELSASSVTRSVLVYGMNGGVKYQASVPAGESRAVIPAAFAPANGYVFQVK